MALQIGNNVIGSSFEPIKFRTKLIEDNDDMMNYPKPLDFEKKPRKINYLEAKEKLHQSSFNPQQKKERKKKKKSQNNTFNNTSLNLSQINSSATPRLPLGDQSQTDNQLPAQLSSQREQQQSDSKKNVAPKQTVNTSPAKPLKPKEPPKKQKQKIQSKPAEQSHPKQSSQPAPAAEKKAQTETKQTHQRVNNENEPPKKNQQAQTKQKAQPPPSQHKDKPQSSQSSQRPQRQSTHDISGYGDSFYGGGQRGNEDGEKPVLLELSSCTESHACTECACQCFDEGSQLIYNGLDDDESIVCSQCAEMYGRVREDFDEPFSKNLVNPLLYLQQTSKTGLGDKSGPTMADDYLKIKQQGHTGLIDEPQLFHRKPKKSKRSQNSLDSSSKESSSSDGDADDDDDDGKRGGGDSKSKKKKQKKAKEQKKQKKITFQDKEPLSSEERDVENKKEKDPNAEQPSLVQQKEEDQVLPQPELQQIQEEDEEKEKEIQHIAEAAFQKNEINKEKQLKRKEDFKPTKEKEKDQRQKAQEQKKQQQQQQQQQNKQKQQKKQGKQLQKAQSKKSLDSSNISQQRSEQDSAIKGSEDSENIHKKDNSNTMIKKSVNLPFRQPRSGNPNLAGKKQQQQQKQGRVSASPQGKQAQKKDGEDKQRPKSEKKLQMPKGYNPLSKQYETKSSSPPQKRDASNKQSKSKEQFGKAEKKGWNKNLRTQIPNAARDDPESEIKGEFEQFLKNCPLDQYAEQLKNKGKLNNDWMKSSLNKKSSKSRKQDDILMDPVQSEVPKPEQQPSLEGKFVGAAKDMIHRSLLRIKQNSLVNTSLTSIRKQ